MVLLLTLPLALVGALVAGAPAAADPVTPDAGPAVALESCWLDSTTDVTRCFADDDARDAAIASVSSAARGAAALATYPLVRIYADAGYTGANLIITGGSPCTTTQSGNLSAAWNDRVSSFQSTTGCTTRLAENTGQGGTLYGPYSSSSALGAFNDRASSWQVT